MGTFKLIFLVLSIGFMNLGFIPKKEPIRLATYAYATNDRIENMKLLSEELEMCLGRKVEITSYASVTSFIAAIKSNEVDIAFINTLGYLILASDNQHMVPLVNMHIKKDGVDNYKTVFLTNSDSIFDYTMIKENSDKLVMMFVKEGSTSGNLVPRLFLSTLNISLPEIQFKEVKYGGNHTSTFEKLINGEADLCAIGSNEYYKKIKEDPTLKDKIKLLWVSEEIPLGPVLINKELSLWEREEISTLFLNLHTKNQRAFESLKLGWSEAAQSNKFQSITDEYYDSFRAVNGNRTALNEILKMFEN